MAFDPIQEDCLRLILEDMHRKGVFPLEDASFIEHGMELYRTDADQLVHTDRDRSFHLTARVAELVDYQLPFITNEMEINRQEDLAEDQLREAIELDPGNRDAQRMLAALNAESNDAYVSFLIDNRSALEDDLARLEAGANDPYSREFASDLGRRPYLRWLASLAAHALISGQYRIALEAAEASLAFAPHDPGDVRHSAMLALAKLEATRDELHAFRRKHALAYLSPSPQRRRGPLTGHRDLDPWSLLAEMSAAWKSYDLEGAERALRTLVKGFPHGAESLFYQAELPEGVFSRVNVPAASDDELVLAISEATPLLQEGIGSPDNACFSTWIANHDIVARALEGRGARPSQAKGRHSGGVD
ncbi:MAG: hypothetical protein SOU51_03240 [Collinsella sp.]|nr:hypothetical protein [Collinsella sp.]